MGQDRGWVREGVGLGREGVRERVGQGWDG